MVSGCSLPNNHVMGNVPNQIMRQGPSLLVQALRKGGAAQPKFGNESLQQLNSNGLSGSGSGLLHEKDERQENGSGGGRRRSSPLTQVLRNNDAAQTDGGIESLRRGNLKGLSGSGSELVHAKKDCNKSENDDGQRLGDEQQGRSESSKVNKVGSLLRMNFGTKSDTSQATVVHPKMVTEPIQLRRKNDGDKDVDEVKTVPKMMGEGAGQVLRPLLLGGMKKTENGLNISGRSSRLCMSVQVTTKSEEDDRKKSGRDEQKVLVDHWKRLHMKVWTYNVQHMNDARTWDVSRCFWDKGYATFVGIQGTQKKYGKGQLRVEQWSTKYHDVWDLRQKVAKDERKYPAGVTILTPLGYKNLVKKVIVPPENDEDMDGRAMILWLKHGNMSIALACVYAQVNTNIEKNIKANERLWYWVQQHMGSINGNKFLMTDANGKVGKYVHNVEEEQVDVEQMLGDGFESRNVERYESIGKCGSENENNNGKMLRKTLEHLQMWAVNTWYQGSSGWTWSGSRCQGEKLVRRSRIDYIATNVSTVWDVKRDFDMKRKLETGRRLKTLDHLPLSVTVQMQEYKQEK